MDFWSKYNEMIFMEGFGMTLVIINIDIIIIAELGCNSFAFDK